MKRYALTITLFLCPLLTVQADILNGFMQKKLILENKINYHETLLNQEKDPKNYKRITKDLKQMGRQYEAISQKYKETEKLLTTILIVDPELYTLVSNITNAEGTLTHVYVRYVSRTSKEFTYYTDEHFKAYAYTSVGQSKENKNVCTSHSGTNTITITIGYGVDARKALGHEFAHVLYIVPHLNEYINYWSRSNDFCSGHSIDDPSFDFLEKIESDFFKKHHEYMKREKVKKSSKPNLASLNDEN